MDAVFQAIENVNTKVNNIVWGIPMLLLLLAVGLYLTVGTRFFQVTKFGYVLKNTIFSMFRKGQNTEKSKDKDAISPFQALATALAATVGTGNIVGVATAIAAGGAGAIFWMWVSAFFGMMTKYAEIVLGIYFRHKNEKGEWVGGPMYYIEKGLHQKWLAVLFAVFCLLASFGIGSVAQVNGISTAMESSFHIPNYVTGIVICLLAGFIVFGGLKRIVTVTEKFVPLMALLYIVGALVVIVANFRNILPAFGEIFGSAFQLKSVGGGVMGYGIARAMRYGFARGIFSNEAGLGSSVLVHSSADVKEPVEQGLWGIFEVFFDTIVICTLTALAILTTGAHTVEGLEGVAITMYAFEAVFGRAGSYVVSVGIVLFAFSTLLGWSVYGCRVSEYLGGRNCMQVYKVLFLLVSFIGSVSSVQLVWDLADTFNGLMALPNLVGVLLLSPLVFRITANYRKRVFQHQNIEPILSVHQNEKFKIIYRK
ncbi:MAG: alanine/glycine:cation symporter family protein [Candidatus Fimenecus sp.]